MPTGRWTPQHARLTRGATVKMLVAVHSTANANARATRASMVTGACAGERDSESACDSAGEIQVHTRTLAGKSRWMLWAASF